MKVQARGRGDLSFEVLPGYAVDAAATSWCCATGGEVASRRQAKMPQTIYWHPVFRGAHRFHRLQGESALQGPPPHREKVKIEVMAREPDGVESIELGRVRLEKGVREIRDALDSGSRARRGRPALAFPSPGTPAATPRAAAGGDSPTACPRRRSSPRCSARWGVAFRQLPARSGAGGGDAEQLERAWAVQPG